MRRAAFIALAICVTAFLVRAESASETKYFIVHKGDNFLEIARNLKIEGYINSRISFVTQIVLSGDYKKLKAGRYFIPVGSTAKSIIASFVQGKVVPIELSVIPGMSVNEISRQLSRLSYPYVQDFLKITLPGTDAGSASRAIFEGRPADAGFEGYLYPDTYKIDSTESAEDLVDLLLANFERNYAFGSSTVILGKRRYAYEIVTMASILEKEVRTEEEKKMVAGILWKRLDVNLPLQVDSTGNYFLEKGAISSFVQENRLSYNTYDHSGLPFGPVSNPSLESLAAAIHPTPSDYWYYLSSREGRIIYSRTLGEHLINKAKFVE